MDTRIKWKNWKKKKKYRNENLKKSRFNSANYIKSAKPINSHNLTKGLYRPGVHKWTELSILKCDWCKWHSHCDWWCKQIHGSFIINLSDFLEYETDKMPSTIRGERLFVSFPKWLWPSNEQNDLMNCTPNDPFTI